MPAVGPPRRSGRPGYAVALILGAGLLSSAPAQSAEALAPLRGSLAEEQPAALVAGPAYRVKPVDGAPVGPGTRLVLETFSGWTLICDAARDRRICNVVQSIAASDGRLAFSWSLAATESGEPVFLVRAPVAGFPAHTVALDFGAGETVIRLTACDADLCLGFLPMDPTIVRRIRENGDVKIQYRPNDWAPRVEITTSLNGISRAMNSVRGHRARSKS